MIPLPTIAATRPARAAVAHSHRAARTAFVIVAQLSGLCTALPVARAQVDAAASTVPEWIIVETSLRRTITRWAKVDAAGIHPVNPSDANAVIPWARVLAMLPAPNPRAQTARLPPSPPDAAPRVRLSLTDGQRIIGQFVDRADAPAKDNADKDHILMLVPVLGETPIAIQLDRIARADVLDPPDQRPPSASIAPTGTDDSVRLQNGDVIRGFIESLGPEISIRAKPDQPETRIPLSRARAVTLSNPPVPATDARVWLADGSVIALEPKPEMENPLSAAARLGGRVHARAADLLAFQADASRLVPLAAVPIASFKSAPDRRWSRPPAPDRPDAPLGAADVVIPGPMTVEWTLPRGAARLLGSIELAPSADGWGDANITIDEVSSAGPAKRLADHHLSSEHPRAELDAGLSTGPTGERRIRVTLDAGPAGPIQDRVILVQPLVIVSPTAK